MEIWNTDANCHLVQKNANKNKKNRTIGGYTYKKPTERDNGRKLLNICDAQMTIPTNPWKRPKPTKRDRKRYETASYRNAIAR